MVSIWLCIYINGAVDTKTNIDILFFHKDLEYIGRFEWLLMDFNAFQVLGRLVWKLLSCLETPQ